MCWILFIPLSKLANQAIYFACVFFACVKTVNFFLFFLFLMIARYKLSQDPLDRFFQSFHQPNDRYLFIDDLSGPIFPISWGTLPWQPIFGKIGRMTFIQQACVPKQIEIWQFWFKNIQWQYCSYIVCKFDQELTSEITSITTAPSWTRRQNQHIPANISTTTISLSIFARLSA